MGGLGPPAHSEPSILIHSLGLDVVRSPSRPNLSLLVMLREEDSPGVLWPPQSRMESGEDNIESFLVQERQEDRAGRQEEHSGRQRNSSGSKSRILAFVTEAAGRGQSYHCVATLHCTVQYCIVLYRTVLYYTILYCTVLYCIVLYCTLYCKCSRPDSVHGAVMPARPRGTSAHQVMPRHEL